jgi:hypothetical protein
MSLTARTPIPWKLDRGKKEEVSGSTLSRPVPFTRKHCCFRLQDGQRLRKEVIQPQVLLQLPCYDFTPIAEHTMDGCLPEGLAHRLPVQPTFVM